MHICPWQTDTHPNGAYIQAKPLHPISFTYSRMHIYPWQMDPTIEHISKENHYTQLVLHIAECTYHYTQVVSHIEECTYTHGRWPPPINNRSMLHHYTQYISHIVDAHILMVGVPPPIDHRCMEYCYTTEDSHIVECMGILLCVRFMGCNGVAWIYGQLTGEV